MKLRVLVEATSKYGDVVWFNSEDDLSSSSPEVAGEFHTDDRFDSIQNMNHIYKFGDGTKLYMRMYKKGKWQSERAMFVNGKLIGERDIPLPEFDRLWEEYKESISGSFVDTQRQFGPEDIEEFRKVFKI